MLLLTDEKGTRQVTVDSLATEFKIPIGKLRKRRLFLLNPNFQGTDLGESHEQRRTVKRSPRGLQRSAFFIFQNSSGIECTLRYCSQAPHKKETGRGVVDVFTPRKVRIEGEGTTVSQVDLALFLYLHPQNKQSPFRTAKYWSWCYDDPEEKADSQIQAVDELKAALDHASSLKDSDLAVFAKGVGMDVSGMDNKSIRAHLLTWAAQNHNDYNQKRMRRSTTYDGLLQDCIDRGIFEFVQRGLEKYWVWTAGPFKGNRITHVSGRGDHPNEVLKSFMKDPDNVAAYRTIIEKLHAKSVESDMLEDVLERDGAYEDNIAPVSASNVFIPSSFTEAEDYLINRHPEAKNPSKKNTSIFFNAIRDGEITADNIEDESLKYINQN